MPTIDSKTYERAYTAAVAFVRKRMAKQPWAESDLPDEMASEATTESLPGGRYPWKGERSFVAHVLSVVVFLMSDRARLAKLHADPKYAGAAEENLKRSAMPADAIVRARDRERRAAEKDAYMLAELTGTAREVYLLYKQEIFDVDQQVATLKKPKSAVYEARRRIVDVAQSYEAPPESSPELAAPDPGDDRDGTDDDDEAAS